MVKVGQRTGLTDGAVMGTCFNVAYGIYGPSGVPVEMQCQYEVFPLSGFPYAFHISGAGDSGGAVFSLISDPQVRFEGIVVAGRPDPSNPTFNTSYIYSPIEGIQADFNRVNAGLSLVTYSP